MSTPIIEGQPRRREHDPKSVEIFGGGSLAETLFGLGAVVMAILGLAGAIPFYMLGICVLAVGAALLAKRGAIVARHERLLHEPESGERFAIAELSGALSAESVAGVLGITLGILYLVGVVPHLFGPVALIGYGGGLLLGAPALWRFADVAERRPLREAVTESFGGLALVGIGAVVLGIIALTSIDWMTICLVGMLGVGFALFLSGSALGARVFGYRRAAPSA